jgi:hypothetical protein
MMPIALLALADDVSLIILLTTTSRIVAPLNLMRVRGGLSLTTEVWLTTVIALWLPLAYIAWRAVRRRMTATRNVDGRDCCPPPEINKADERK